MSGQVEAVVGVSFTAGYPGNLHALASHWELANREPIPVVLIRNPANPHDSNAIEVHVPALGDLGMIGHLRRDLAAHLAPLLDAGELWQAWIYQLRINPHHPDRPGIDIGIRPVDRDDNHPTNQPTGGTHMGTQLNTGSGSKRPPSAKVPNNGNTLTFAVVDVNPNVPMSEYGTGNPVLNRFGQQKMQTALTVLVVAADGATIGNTDDAKPAQPGDVATIYIEGYAKWDPDQDKLGGAHVSWGKAVDLAGGLEVGMVGQYKHLGELPSKGSFPRVNRKFALRKAKPEEAAQVQRCEELHRELNNPTQLVGAAQGPGPFDTPAADPGPGF